MLFSANKKEARTLSFILIDRPLTQPLSDIYSLALFSSSLAFSASTRASGIMRVATGRILGAQSLRA